MNPNPSLIPNNPNIPSHTRNLLLRALLILSLLFPLQMQAAFSKHPTSIVQRIGARYEAPQFPLSSLSGSSEGPGLSAIYYCGPLAGKTAADPNYITVELKGEGLSQNDEDDLVVYLRRTTPQDSYLTNINQAQPTAMGVQVWFTYTDGQLHYINDYIFKVYFQFRGYSTEEYSSRIHIKDIWNHLPSYMNGIKISYLRFFTLETNNDLTYSARSNKLRETALNSFDVLKIPHDSPYSDTWEDRFHLRTDRLTDLEGVEFVNTRGVFDEPNRPSGWEEVTSTDEATLKSLGINIDFPDYKLLDSNTSAYPLASGQKRQPAHTVEHILYAMPGDVIPLYPYYDLPNPAINQFQENFSHWYDYKTGGRIQYETPWNEKYDLLDFLSNPEKVQVTDSYGFFGGKGMNCSKEYKISTVEEYIELANEINDKDSQYRDAYIEIVKDLDFGGRTDIPMLGLYRPFKGTLNGNGHTIKNLIYNYPDSAGVGFIGVTEGNVLIENLVLDNTCKFIGSYRVGGIVGRHNFGNLSIRNIKTEAWVYGVRKSNEQNAGGILGYCGDTSKETSISVEDCYIGGIIGNPETNINNSFNAALIAGLWVTTGISKFKNIIVDCELTGRENVGYPNKVYIRHGQNTDPITIDGQGVLCKGNLRFQNCFGDDDIDPYDECWNILQRRRNLVTSGMIEKLGWSNFETPSMYIGDYSNGYSPIYRVSTADEYIEAVKKINEGNQSNAYIELLDHISFKGKDVPMLYEHKDWDCFKGCINGNGFVIKDLNINRNRSNVGLVAWGGQGIKILNLVLDSSCKIRGTGNAGIIGRFYGGDITIHSLKSEASIQGAGDTGILFGLCGWDEGNHKLDFKNIYLGGSLTYNGTSGAIVGSMTIRDATNTSTLKNIVFDCNVSSVNSEGEAYVRTYNCGSVVSVIETNNGLSGGDRIVEKKINNNNSGVYTFKFANCYGNLDSSDICFSPFTYTIDIIKPTELTEWKDLDSPNIKKFKGYEKLRGNGDRLPGTMATFFCPRNPYDNSLFQSLPLNGEKEYIIAADFSQRFDPVSQITEEGDKVKIMEPAIAFRHIFRIRDGKQFADEISASIDNNNNYIRRNQKRVSTRSNVPFQIRLDFPAPICGSNSKPHSNYYYKISDNEYGRVFGMAIKVFDGDTRKLLSGEQGFSFGADFYGRGIREINGIKYDVLDGCNSTNQRYNRMLYHGGMKEGHYIVQIVGLDVDGNRIKIMGSDQDLVIMEYNIIALPPKGGTMLTESELYSSDNMYENARVEYLNENYGGENKQPNTYIDFDEYIKINEMKGNDALKNKLIAYINYDKGNYTPSTPTPNGKESSYFKWPVPWDQSNYSFGYNLRQDYNMYMLATHSDCTPYMLAAQAWTNNMPGDYPGLYDRSYYDSMRLYKNNQTRAGSDDKIKQGYFYYVNAASDPGVTARLTINDLCQGSTIHVSAWLAEFSKDTEKANLSFNFVAVLADGYENSHPTSGLKGGDRVVLHSFITGQVKKTGEWLNVYYSFVPRLAEFSSVGITSDDVDHYELELDNNAKSSAGADYAIDNIRAYVEPPSVEAQQLSPACRDERMRMLLGSPFETLLEIAGKRESIGDETDDLDVYYTYLDKELFDKLYYQEKKSMEEAFNSSIITFNYNTLDEEDGTFKDDRTFGKISFNGNYSMNTGYHEDDEDIEFGQAYSQTKESGQRMIVFESEISSGKLLANKHYYVIFKSALGDNDVPQEGQEYAFFNLSDPCANTCVAYIKPPIITKIDGKIIADVENISICENQSPVIQVNLTGLDDDGEPFDLEKNVYFDWFYGSREELDRYTDGDDTHTLFRALTAMRLRYEDEVSLDTLKTDDNLIEGEKFEQWMLDLLKKASKPEGNNSIAKLVLYKSSFVMPPARMGEDGKPFTHYVTVLPIACVPLGSYKGDSSKLVCSTPTPIPITVDAKSPLLMHGLSGIDYPDDLTDVPLRIGIDQLKSNLTGSSSSSRRLDLPIRLTLSSDNKSKELKVTKEETHTFVGKDKEVSTVEKEGAVVLVQTNDPEYKDLGTLYKDSIEIGTLFWVGEIKSIVAKTNQDESKQYVQLEFDNSFNFKEGYMYKFRFQYEEVGVTPNDSVCSGQDVFTIKVVPRYLAWTGDNNLNWNDDSNWRRVGKNDLQINDMRRNTLAHYLNDGYRGTAQVVNPNTKAFVPLDFTNVIVEKGMEAPFMYEMSQTKEVKDEYDSNKKYIWPSNPEKGSNSLQDDDPGEEGVGKVTPLIHYDMAAFEFDDSNRRESAEVGCRPWYANTCNEIHFKPGGTIMNQQSLVYEKAWVDMELDHSRWYTVSSPLKEVYAGDFYLPSDGARQETELYQDITFDNSRKNNDRFKPAVFQRGWDKSVANVYELDASKQEVAGARNVAVKTFWSHVYNDVKEQYGGGVGFSIKTDISRMTKNKPGDDGKVLFRLPKSDTNYLYWNKDGSKSGHSTNIDRSDAQYKLNASNGTLTLTSAGKCEYFLVGNPFMTHMDIAKFLEKNSGQLEQKYWVVTKSVQIAGGIDGSDFIAAGPTDSEWAEDPTVIAPMQGFFVKTKEAEESVTLIYDESMMRRYDNRSGHEGEYLTETTRGNAGSMLRIVAESDGLTSSAALLGVNDSSKWNVEAIDNRDMDIPSIVYTVGNGMALSINSVEDAEGTEIGVIADEDTETILRFEGVDCIDGLYLLDKSDHSLTPVEEGMEVAVEGAAAGRFFLTYGMAEEGMMSGIDWKVSGGVLTAVDYANTGHLQVNVYDTLGRLVKSATATDNIITLPLDSGIFVVEITTPKDRQTPKIQIK